MLFSAQEYLESSKRLQDLLCNLELVWGVTSSTCSMTNDPSEIWRLVRTWLPIDDSVFARIVDTKFNVSISSDTFDHYYPFHVWEKLVECLEEFIKDNTSERSYFYYLNENDFNGEDEEPVEPEIQKVIEELAQMCGVL